VNRQSLIPPRARGAGKGFALVGALLGFLAVPAWADLVPDVVGLEADKALEMTRALGMEPRAEYSPDRPAGRVFSQEPGGLADRPRGTEVVLRIGGSAPAAPTPVPVPTPTPTPPTPTPSVPDPVPSLPPSDAQPLPPTGSGPSEPLPMPGPAPAPAPGPTVPDVAPPTPPTGGDWPLPAPTTTTPSPTPPSGTTAPGNATPEAAVNRQGPDLPNAIQMPQAEAQTALSRWRVNVEYTLASPTLVGRVVNQIPYPGESLATGEMVTIVVGIAQLPSLDYYVVPMVEGGDAGRALQELERVQMRASFRSVPSAPAQRGLVVSQNPLPGSVAPRGSEVIVRVGSGSPTTAAGAPVPSAAPVEPPPAQMPVAPPPTVPQPTPPQPTPPQPTAPMPVQPTPTPPPTPQIQLGRPSLLAPAADSTFPKNYGATFQWSAVQGAQRYEWELHSEQGGQWALMATMVVQETRYRPERMPAGRFRWRVRAVADNAISGGKGEWSDFLRLYMY
jgi:beta-lactam-binding protein with PASTA domain